jgi:hypothetical protein
MKLLRIAAAIFAVAAVAGSCYRADGFPIPGVPGVPGVNPRDAAIKVAARQFTPWVAANQPIIRDWSAVYPTVTTLPGPAFSPNKDPGKFASALAYFKGALTNYNGGEVDLPQGDYAFKVRVYCTSWYAGNIHRGYAGHKALWLLGPIKGSRADILQTTYARASLKGLPFSDVQTLSWALQAGMRYDQFPARQQQMVNQLIPDLKNLILGSFEDQAKAEWNRIAGTVPNVPSFDSALSSMGSAGQTIVDMNGARDQIIANAENFDAMRHALAPPGGADDSNAGDPPWSIVAPGLYERLITEGYLGSTGMLQVRVTAAASTDLSSRLLAFGPVGVRSDAIRVAYGHWGKKSGPNDGIGYAPAHPDWQPLTYTFE